MDKSWIDARSRIGPYLEGVEQFLDFAYISKRPTDEILCPCKDCDNRYFLYRNDVKAHLILNGMQPKYKNWTYHGESHVPFGGNQGIDERDHHMLDDIPNTNVLDDTMRMVYEAMGPIPNIDCISDDDELPDPEHLAGCDSETAKFLKLLKDAEKPLYTECKSFTALSFLVRIMHLKVLGGWTNKSMTMLLRTLNEAFPPIAIQLPKSYYEANKLTANLGFSYTTLDACPNHCMLFRNETKDLDTCKICGASRYKESNGGNGGKKVAVKKARYFPLKPRLKRLFMSSKTASLMRWHSEKRVDDGLQRHPADSLTWKEFDQRHPNFANDSRNVKLGLAADGFNPFRTMSIAHSTWPVVVMPYNLPPWLCMKQPYFMLSVLIESPKGLGDKIDVYLQPLIEELNSLWNEGVLTYDAATKKMFNLHAALLWTISDFPAYANLSGWSTKGEFACPCCNMKTRSLWLKNGGKFCYWGHRRFLPMGHKFRRETKTFDGNPDFTLKPNVLSGAALLLQLKDLGVKTEYKKEDVLKNREREEIEKQSDEPKTHSWKKQSIFWELPYWEHNSIRHNIDVMHTENFFCDNVLFTILGSAGKSKDHLKARRDLQLMNIRKAQHPQPRANGKEYLPPARFAMSKDHKDIFLKVLKNIKLPDGYASNISRCVHPKERSIWGLKSHDSHVLMQHLLPLAVRKALPHDVVSALIELSNCFKELCSKKNKASDFEALQD